MESKKGQLTIFIILGVVILMVAGAIFFLNRSVQLEPEEEVFHFNRIKAYMENCVQETLQEAIFWNGKQGGYYEPPDENVFFFSNLYQMPYYGGDTLPEIYVYEEEIDKFVEDNLQGNCNISIFSDQGIFITASKNPEVETKITDYGFILNLNYPLEIEQGAIYQNINVFEAVYPLNFKRIYDSAQAIIEGKEEDGLICLNCPDQVKEELQYQEYFHLDDGRTYITIFDGDYEFTFATKYSGLTVFEEFEDEI